MHPAPAPPFLPGVAVDLPGAEKPPPSKDNPVFRHDSGRENYPQIGGSTWAWAAEGITRATGQ